jgi:hypothetical protein
MDVRGAAHDLVHLPYIFGAKVHVSPLRLRLSSVTESVALRQLGHGSSRCLTKRISFSKDLNKSDAKDSKWMTRTKM